MTTTDSPSVGSASRTPCNAIAPSVPNAAASKSTSSGTRTHKFCGTDKTSACEANPAPAQATRSPAARPRTSAPASSTMPAAL